MEKKMTPNIEEYLEALFHLSEKDKPISTKELAEQLNISPASVSDMVKKLKKQKLVKYVPYRGVSLTKNGLKAAAILVRRHRLSERFLADMLDVPWEDLHDEACKFEHVISENVEEKLLEALGNPKTCPHGNPIPSINGETREEEVLPITELGTKDSGVITKITEEEPEFLHYLASLGLFPEVTIKVDEIAPFGGPIIIKKGNASYALGRDIASKIFLKPTKRGQRGRKKMQRTGLKRRGS